MSIIGGADGPTSVFLAGELGVNWINFLGLITVIIILIPNVIYGLKNKGVKNLCRNKVMNILEQIGRYGCMIFMIFNIGIPEFGYNSEIYFLVGFLFVSVLLALYIIFWVVYFVNRSMFTGMVLAIIPSLIFLINGVTLRYWPLLVCAVIFSVAHCYVTYVNHKKV